MDHKIRLEMPAKKEPHSAFGKRLFALRKTRGLTQVQLAEALGTTQRVISYYETEAELPPSTAIIPLARVLEVSTDELLGLKPAEPNGNSSIQKQRLWKRFQKMDVLPTKDQRAVIRLINSLAGSSTAEAS
ncbi:MAG: helix-turn-helix transcriptional regulator [Terracidiphilus sp.]|jgi:transcriptional regulator with XRE-family HTH domain